MKKRHLKTKFKILLIIFIVLFLVCLSIAYINRGNKKIEIKEEKSTTKKIINEKKSAKLTLVGDLLFEQPLYDDTDYGKNADEYLSLVKEYFINDDLSIGNMEVVIGNESLKVSGVGYNFCAPKSIGDLVSSIDFEVLSTANNHAYDRKIAGVFSTIDYFKNNTDILTVGTYKDEEDRNNLRILNINGIKFGFLSYTLGTNIKVPNEYKNLIAFYRNQDTKTVTNEDKETLKKEITKLKENVDVVIVSMHWGKEFTFTPNNEQKEMAKYLNSLGVDIIVGAHSHSMQPLEIIEDEYKTLVYYSLGNFISADDDIARTPLGQETFDNAYQIGLLSQLNVILDENKKVDFENITVEPIITYFDKSMHNFKLVPYSKYTEEYEINHNRYKLGFTKSFIDKTYDEVINKEYHIKTN